MASYYYSDKHEKDVEHGRVQALDTLADKMSHRVRSHVVAIVGEFCGTL